MKILVGSTNPTKVEAVRIAFLQYFSDVEVEGMSVESSVSNQPFGEETFIGAKNRAMALQKHHADFFVGIEAGIFTTAEQSFCAAVTCIMNKDGKVGYGTTPHFPIASKVMDEINLGKEMALVIDELLGETDNNRKSGLVGYLTKGVMNRTQYNLHAITAALIPFVNSEMYHSK